jgi:hypothetical protein
MISVVIFTEGEFDSVALQTTLEEAHGFEAGFAAGARAYGAGSFATYVLPYDGATMETQQTPSEVVRAKAAVQAVQALAHRP